MIASWPQAALRGGTSLANPNSYSPICSIGNPAIRIIRRGSPQQKTEAARSQEAAPVYLRPSTLPETWERSSLSDEGIREALRARTKHFATLEETEKADSASTNPESGREQQEADNGSSPPKQPQRKKGKQSVTPSSTKSPEADKEDGLSERQIRRRRVGWALHKKRTGQPVESSMRGEKQRAVKYSRELEVQLCSQIQEAQKLRQVCEDIAQRRDQLPEQEWARAAGLKSTKSLRAVLQAGSAAEKRIVSEHQGFLISLASKFAHQGVTQEELLVEAQTSLIGAAEKFDVSKKARLTSYAWFDIMRCLQRLCQTEGALLPMARSALHDLYRLDKAEKELSQQNASEPTLSEVAAKAGITPGRAKLLRERQKTVAYESISLDFKGGNHRGADEIMGTAESEDTASQDPDIAICEREKVLHVRSIVSLALDALAGPADVKKETYNRRLVRAMRLRYGLDDDQPRTLKEVSLDLKTSIETVRNLVEEGKERLAAILAQEGLIKDLRMSA